MVSVVQITFLCCLVVLETVGQPIAKSKAEDISSLKEYLLKRLRDNLYELPPTMYFKNKKELPPMMYFQDAEELPPTLYIGDELEDPAEFKKDRLAPLPPILAGWPTQDEGIIEVSPKKVHSGWRAGDVALRDSANPHSGSRGGDATLTDARKSRTRSKRHVEWRVRDTDEVAFRR